MSLENDARENPPDILIDGECEGMPSPAIRLAWGRLLATSTSSEKIFQTPEYFQFICNNPDKHSIYKLFYIKPNSRDEIRGLIPALAGPHVFNFQIKHWKVMPVRVPVVMLLGSMPLLPNEPSLLDSAVAGLFKQFPSYSCLYLQAIPFDSQFHQYIVSSQYIQKHYFVFVKDGWRRCHTRRLPASFAAFQEAIKTKRRYNIRRQIRSLALDGGAVTVTRIDTAAAVPSFIRALDDLAGAERTDFLNARQYAELAAKDILLCYVMRCAGVPVAAIVGIRSERTFMVHRIIYDHAFARHSPGTSIVYLATEDMIDRLGLNLIDYGFGASKQVQKSSGQGELRGQLFLFKRTFKNLALMAIYKLFMNFVSLSKKLYAHQPRTPSHFFSDPH